MNLNPHPYGDAAPRLGRRLPDDWRFGIAMEAAIVIRRLRTSISDKGYEMPGREPWADIADADPAGFAFDALSHEIMSDILAAPATGLRYMRGSGEHRIAIERLSAMHTANHPDAQVVAMVVCANKVPRRKGSNKVAHCDRVLAAVVAHDDVRVLATYRERTVRKVSKAVEAEATFFASDDREHARNAYLAEMAQFPEGFDPVADVWPLRPDIDEGMRVGCHRHGVTTVNAATLHAALEGDSPNPWIPVLCKVPHSGARPG